MEDKVHDIADRMGNTDADTNSVDTVDADADTTVDVGAEAALRLDEEDFLEALGLAFQKYGYDPSIIEQGEYPLTLSVEFPDTDGSKLEATILFVPLEFLTGDDVQTLQIYFHLYTFGRNYPRYKLLELEHAANYCSCNSPIGTFGVQPEPGMLCCKQALALRGVYGEINALTMTLDAFLLMLNSINMFYDGLIAIAKGETNLEKAQRDNIFPPQ